MNPTERHKGKQLHINRTNTPQLRTIAEAKLIQTLRLRKWGIGETNQIEEVKLKAQKEQEVPKIKQEVTKQRKHLL